MDRSASPAATRRRQLPALPATRWAMPAAARTRAHSSTARHYTIAVAGRTAENAAWFYPAPAPGYETIADHVAFYPARVDACYVDGERVQAQQGDFYGGWITRDVSGPFKGGPGTQGW